VDQGAAIRLTVRGPHVTLDAGLGDSIAVNGCCLTVAERDQETFTADVMRETLDKTSLGGLEVGSRVNLERASHRRDPLGGHIVRATSTARAPWSPHAVRAPGAWSASACRPGWPATWCRSVDHRRRDLADRRRRPWHRS
jgi:hypothetical protein